LASFDAQSVLNMTYPEMDFPPSSECEVKMTKATFIAHPLPGEILDLSVEGGEEPDSPAGL
jgi:hypothetical protein